MIKNNLWKFVWYFSIIGILLIILYLVVLYKVTWETRDFNTYLYFYECSDAVCTSITKPKDIKYNKIVCDNKECPYISNILGDIVILNNSNGSWLYDYKKGSVYSDGYTEYEFIGNEYFKVIDSNSMQTVIDKDLKLILTKKYKNIIDFKDGLVIYEENGKQGIDYASGEGVISPMYDEINIINNTMYSALNDNKYQIYNVVNNSLKNNIKYDYIWSSDNLLVVVYNNQLDILNNRLESNLLMKIKTYFSYSNSLERKSLKIYSDESYIYFNLNISNVEYTKYKYDIKNKKILTYE